jgi:methylated-DNA-[protein]-cysteine S-methyltransferase
MTSTLRSIQSTCIAQARLDSPLGTMRLARNADGLAGAWFVGQQHDPGELAAPLRPGDTVLRAALQQLADYFAGRDVAFDLPLAPQGTPFQHRVWDALRRIGRGSTCRYADIARQLGAPGAARAVGAAVARNPLSVIVPCHRVLGAGGALTGYAGGLDRKVALLELERPARGRFDAAARSEATA